MATSRFNPNAKVTVAQTGTKVSADTAPFLTVKRAVNSFSINGKGTDLLGVSKGDRVKFISIETDDINAKYFMVVSPEGDESGAALTQVSNGGKGRPASFTYAGIWSQMITGEADAPITNIQDLIDKGIAKDFKTTVNEKGEDLYNTLCTQEVRFKIELDSEDVEIDGVLYSELYVLTDMEIIEMEAPTVMNRKVKPDHKKSKATDDVKESKDADDNTGSKKVSSI